MQQLNLHVGLLATDVATLTHSNPGTEAICNRSTNPHSEQCLISNIRQEYLQMAVVITAFVIHAEA